MSVDVVLYVLTFICFVVKALGVNTGQVDLGWVGAALLVLSLVI